jgi:hypothetical protein
MLWICGQNTDIEGQGWEFQGVFSSEELAIKACRDWTYFIAPMTLDEEVPHETFEMPGCYYPIARHG